MAQRKKLTTDAVKKATADLRDTEIPGFRLRVYPPTKKGEQGKVFWLVYRLPGAGKVEWLKLGAYGALSAEEARRLAKEKAALVTQGENPAEARRELRSAPTVAELGVAFLADVQARRKPTTAREHARRWMTHIAPEKPTCPVLGTMRVAEVTAADVARLHAKLSKTPYEANRVLALVGAFFTFAEQQGARARHTNPAPEVKPYAEDARERFLSDAELVRLGAALARAEREGLPPAPTKRRKVTEGKTARNTDRRAHVPKTVKHGPADPFAVAALRLLLLTGWRVSEVLGLRWEQVDAERGIATLPDTKAGRSHRHLGAPALELLAELPREAGHPYCFPSHGGRRRDPNGGPQPIQDLDRLWYAVRHAAGLDDVRLHDLRHTNASVSAERGESLLVIGKLLGHKRGDTTARYAHLADNPLRRAADGTSAHIAALLAGGNAAREAIVLPISSGTRR